MRLLPRAVVLSLPLLAGLIAAQDGEVVDKKSFGYQSDVARLRKIVINSLYSHRDVFLRELISNANDALEKLRISTLKDKSGYNAPMNITIKAIRDEEGTGGRLVITDYGLGMSAEELSENLGTLAKSGTSEFLSKAESGDASNLIGQFGVGFYSAFLVSDRVYVASVPGPTKENPAPVQNVFSSNSDDASFDIYPDPRGNTLGRGTEITLILKDDATEYLSTDNLKDLVIKHSAFSTSYPIYLQVTETEQVPDHDAIAEEEVAAAAAEAEATPEATPETTETDADDEVEDVVEDAAEEAKPEKVIPTKNITTTTWAHLNDQLPIWQRDAKNVSRDEYDLFFRHTFKDSNNPLGVHHFKGDAGSISFKAMLFIPPTLDKDFWQSARSATGSIKLMVKRVFITSDFGDYELPKWISWLRAVVDADDLPLNVSRETLQSTRFLSQIKQVLINRAIALLAKISEEDPATYKKIIDLYGPAFKLGAVESQKERTKLVGLTRWNTNLRNSTSLDEILAKKKKGQNQIFFLAGAGSTRELLAKSVFIEKLHARGYEVILATEPMDEVLMTNLRHWKGLNFQDVSKKGLRFGDEDEEGDDEKEDFKSLEERFKPLIEYVKVRANETVKEVILSNRLVTSACAIVADQMGYSPNMERLMASQNNGPNPTLKDGQSMIHEWARKQKALEINPRSPLIEGLLRKVNLLEDVEEGQEKDAELEAEIDEIVSILIDGALVRSGFEVEDKNEFFTRIDRVLRRSLGVSETAKTDDNVKPAPAEEPSTIIDLEANKKLAASLDEDVKVSDTPEVEIPDVMDMGDWSQYKDTLKLPVPEADASYSTEEEVAAESEAPASSAHDEL